MTYLLDSVVLIDHFNGIEAATTFLAEHGSRCAISVITRAEVLAGFDEERESLARELLDADVSATPTAKSPENVTALLPSSGDPS